MSNFETWFMFFLLGAILVSVWITR